VHLPPLVPRCPHPVATGRNGTGEPSFLALVPYFIDPKHRSEASIRSIDPKHRSEASIRSIDPKHRSTASIRSIDPKHRSEASIRSIDPKHRIEFCFIKICSYLFNQRGHKEFGSVSAASGAKELQFTLIYLFSTPPLIENFT